MRKRMSLLSSEPRESFGGRDTGLRTVGVRQYKTRECRRSCGGRRTGRVGKNLISLRCWSSFETRPRTHTFGAPTTPGRHTPGVPLYQWCPRAHMAPALLWSPRHRTHPWYSFLRYRRSPYESFSTLTSPVDILVLYLRRGPSGH